jgi:hypothetical protein
LPQLELASVHGVYARWKGIEISAGPAQPAEENGCVGYRRVWSLQQLIHASPPYRTPDFGHTPDSLLARFCDDDDLDPRFPTWTGLVWHPMSASRLQLRTQGLIKRDSESQHRSRPCPEYIGQARNTNPACRHQRGFKFRATCTIQRPTFLQTCSKPYR